MNTQHAGTLILTNAKVRLKTRSNSRSVSAYTVMKFNGNKAKNQYHE